MNRPYELYSMQVIVYSSDNDKPKPKPSHLTSNITTVPVKSDDTTANVVMLHYY